MQLKRMAQILLQQYSLLGHLKKFQLSQIISLNQVKLKKTLLYHSTQNDSTHLSLHPKLMGIEDEDKSIIWSCSKVHIDINWETSKNSHKKEFYNKEGLVDQGEKIFYYAFKADNKIHIGNNYFELKDDNTIITG